MLAGLLVSVSLAWLLAALRGVLDDADAIDAAARRVYGDPDPPTT